MDNYQKPRRRRRGLLALLMAGAALISTAGATMSLAVFTSQVVVAGNGFTAGTVVLTVSPASAILNMTPPPYLMPGDVVPAGLPGPGVPVLVTNTGTADLRYALSGTSTDVDTKHLNQSLIINVKTSDSPGGNTCTTFSGTSLFSGTVLTGPGSTKMVGDALQGYQAIPGLGDRTLTAGAHETLCFKASLPSTTLNGPQGGTTTYTFTFDAEQTQSNP